MKTVRFVLFITAGAPALPMPLDRAAATINENVGAVQENFLQVMGATFALEPCLIYRSAKPIVADVWALAYSELEKEGIIPRSFGGDVLYYVQVWHPQPCVTLVTTGTQMAKPIGRCLDDAGPIEDFLGIGTGTKRPSNPASTMKNQARGRIRHELEHGLGGAHPELIFGNWWDYGVSGSIPPASPARSIEILSLNKDWLGIR